MPHATDPHTSTTVEQLESLLGELSPASLKKEVPFVHPHYRALIEASPFAVLATTGPGGLDASPRGDAPGFVVVENETTPFNVHGRSSAPGCGGLPRPTFASACPAQARYWPR
jgi:hypothetical protein